MSLQIGAVCCIVLLALGAALWWTARARTSGQTDAEDRAPQRRTAPHPRLDLAAGLVPSSQAVRHLPRQQGVQPPVQKQAPVQAAYSRRPDRAYFNQDNGDLRDPEPGGAPAGGILRPTGSLARPER